MATKLEMQDVKMANALKNVVAQGNFQIKGDAVKQVASLLIWLETLGDRIAETLKPLPVEEKKKK